MRFKPDLVVASLGLNDSHGEIEKLGYYTSVFQGIFHKLQETDIENYLHDLQYAKYISTNDFIRLIAEHTVPIEIDGIADRYFEEGIKVAKECDVGVCDCHAKWKLLEKNGVDTTMLLANAVNYHTREMNWLFAYSLVETIMQN